MRRRDRFVVVVAVPLLTTGLLVPVLATTSLPAAAAPSPVPASDLLQRGVAAVVEPATWRWHVHGRADVVWGRAGDVAVPADYDGDGRTDVAVWRPSTGEWWLRGLGRVAWGQRGDVPVPADYDRDGRTDPAVWRPSTGEWWLRGIGRVAWGSPGDRPVPADYDGDRRADVAVWRPSSGRWLVRGLPDATWGRRGDVVVPADYDGDGRTDAAVWRPSSGRWLVRGLPDATWGRRGDRPVRFSGPSTSVAPFRAVVTPAPARRMRASWRKGCPVPLADLRLLTVSHVGFDGLAHRGELVVNRRYAASLAGVFGRLYAARFPIRRMHLVDEYGADDDRSMSDDNSSAFSCRAVTGRPGVWSQHSYGWAVDLNPFENPYVSGSTVLPAEARLYADRSRRDPGMVHAGDATVRAFSGVGWPWGGGWKRPKDYQHFSATGR